MKREGWERKKCSNTAKRQHDFKKERVADAARTVSGFLGQANSLRAKY
jgi:hypothetical protein